MKINYYCSIALSALLLISCTSSEIGKESGSQPNSKKDAYTTVTVKLPALSGSVTKAYPDYDAGLPGEYNVKDLTLLFFRTAVDGADPSTVAEGDFVLSEVVSTIPDLSTGTVLPAGSISDNSSPVVGTVIKKFTTQPISIDSRSVRVLALLNVGEIKAIAQPLLKIGYPFKTINGVIPLTHNIDVLTGGVTKDCFVMTSAPVYAAPAMNTLAVCVPQSSEQAAIAAPVTINVERIVAKVQLKAKPDTYLDDAGTYYFTVKEGSHKGDKITILDWTLGNTNTSAYPFRVVAPAWATLDPAIWQGAICPAFATTHARIHWAEDPNYTQGAYVPSPFASPDKIEKVDVNNVWPDKTEYCIENTCNFVNMNKSVVTRLIVKTKYIPNASNQVGGDNTFDTDGTWWSFTTVAAHYSAQNMYKKIIDWVAGSLTTAHPNMPASPEAGDITVPPIKPLNGISVKWSVKLTADGDSHYKLTEVSYIPTGRGTSTPITLAEADLAGFQSSMGKIQKYDQGFCYYEIFIRHFTEDEGGYAPAGGTAWVKDGDYKAAQLGRYGVVRNNWYTVTINSIKQPGDPVIPTDPDEPVDTQTSYIDCSIEISAWAKRDHHIDL